jgi:hypothetical protein
MAGSLPRASEAAVDPAKFVDYSMNPANRGNQGKWIAFVELGYDVSTPEERVDKEILLPRLITNWLEVHNDG